MQTVRYLAFVAVAAALVIGAYLGLSRNPAAPAVSLTYLDGSTRELQAWRGQVVLVNFWATSCASCIREMPKLAETYQTLAPRGLQTVAVAMSYDDPRYVAAFAQTRRLPFAVAHDASGAVAKGFGDVQLTPTTFVINRRGEIVKRYVGEPDFVALQALLDRLLSEPAPAV